MDVFSFGVVLYEMISGRVAILQGDLDTSLLQSGSSQGRTLTSLVCFFRLPILLLSDENVSDRVVSWRKEINFLQTGVYHHIFQHGLLG